MSTKKKLSSEERLKRMVPESEDIFSADAVLTAFHFIWKRTVDWYYGIPPESGVRSAG